MEPILQNLAAVFAGDDLANKLRRRLWLVTDDKRIRQKLLRLGKARLLIGEECAEWLPCLNGFAQFHGHVNVMP